MGSIIVRDKKFTYTRISPIQGEVTETAIAHFVVSHAFSDRNHLTFYNISPEGNPYIVSSVSNVLEFDGGTVVSEFPAYQTNDPAGH